MPEYLMFQTTDAEGRQVVCGGMMKRQAPEQGITNYVGVPSVDEYTARIEGLGGQIIMPKTTVPGHGYFAVCLDTENNGFGLWEHDPSAK